jgi:hypothetical protein
MNSVLSYILALPSQLEPRNGQLQAELDSSYCLTAMAMGQGRMCSVNFSIHLTGLLTDATLVTLQGTSVLS